MRSLLLLAVLSGCSQPAQDVKTTEPVASSGRDVGWVAVPVLQPERFEALVGESPREGWVALHAGDYAGAWAAFGDGPEAARGRARTALAQAQVHGELQAASELAWARWIAGQRERTGFPEDSPADAFLAWSQGEDLDGAPAALTERWTLHQQAVSAGPDALLAVAAEPVMVEPADGFERKWFDPGLHGTLAESWAARAAGALGTTAEPAALATALVGEQPDLATSLFAPWPDGATLLANPGLLSWSEPVALPAWEPLGVDAPLPEDGALEAAREQVRALDAALDAWKEELANRATPDGRALLLDLGLAERYRTSWLVARSREALAADRPLVALAYAERALDAEHAREVGPTSPPEVFAVLAHARLAQGHTREALDALAALSERYPETLGLSEVIGNLAVLEGVDRRGDSKEN